LIRFTSTCVVVGSLLLITAIVSGAGNPQPATPAPLIVEMALFESDGPATRPASDLETLMLLNGKELSCIKALAPPDGPFFAEASVGDHVIRLNGSIKTLDQAHYRINIEYTDKSSAGIQSITSIVEARLDDRKSVGGLNAGNARSMIVLSLHKQDPESKK
jgi:hypothetical protein